MRGLFDFAGAVAPQPSPSELVWEARVGDRLVGGMIVERDGPQAFVHGPVVIEPPPGVEPLEVARGLVAPLLETTTPAPGTVLDRIFARPQGVDRLWVRTGFVPVPEATLPSTLRGRPGSGLYLWRRPGTFAIATPDPEGRRRGGRRSDRG